MKKVNFSISVGKRLFLALFFAFSLLFLAYLLDNNTSAHTDTVFEKETGYYLARVVDTTIPGSGDARILFLDFDSHSIEYKNKQKAPLSYLSIYPVFGILKPDGIKTINMIGGGAYTLPKNLANFYKNSEVTVVEVDGQVSDIARKYFSFDGANIKTITSDARVFFRKNDKKYDLIFGDAYNSFISVPWHLVTDEFTKLVKTRLNDNGIYAVNFISSIKGENALFFNSMVKTFSKTFPNYYVFAFGNDLFAVQNIVLVGMKGNVEAKTTMQLKKKLASSPKTASFSNLLVGVDDIDFSDAILLTDDFAPVERLMLPTVNSYFPRYLFFFNTVFK
jgi:spermidine synthase